MYCTDSYPHTHTLTYSHSIVGRLLAIAYACIMRPRNGCHTPNNTIHHTMCTIQHTRHHTTPSAIHTYIYI
ncbi:hypothetical protein EON63_12385 [archaeon]|nr:MAG: hypothetical protein EON63_12385 [archaeon]